MLSFKEVNTWGDLLEALRACSPEQLDQPVQTVCGHPDDTHVHALNVGIIFGTIESLGIRYARSSTDNRMHGEHLIIYTDVNPHPEKGPATIHNVHPDDLCDAFAMKSIMEKPVDPRTYDPSQDWTGPAQELADKAEKKKEAKNNIVSILKNRISRFLGNEEDRS